MPKPNLANSPRLEQLIRDGKLYISLQDAISLALENNLDLAIARYNLPIADTDIQRTKAGGSFRGVNTGVVQGTPGGGVGGFGAGAPGAGAGGTTGGAGGAGAGAAGLVQSTLGIGTNVSSYDPIITGIIEHRAPDQPLVELADFTVCRHCRLNTGNVNLNYSQAFPTGTSFSLEVDNNRQTTQQYFQQPESDAELVLSLHRPAAVAGGIRHRPEPAFSAHREEQQEDLRHRVQDRR